MHYAYIHGFASSSKSRKGTALAEHFAKRGVTIHRPDLNAPSFEKLTIRGVLSALTVLDAEHAGDGERWAFVGSSLGGYVSALWAARNPHRVDRLLLLCPGFDLGTRWPMIIGAEAFAQWERRGTHVFPDARGTPVPVHWGFVEDARHFPMRPAVPCPCRIVHGIGDETVPIESSRRYVEEHPEVELIEVDDDHGLAASIERIIEEVEAFFFAAAGTDEASRDTL